MFTLPTPRTPLFSSKVKADALQTLTDAEYDIASKCAASIEIEILKERERGRTAVTLSYDLFPSTNMLIEYLIAELRSYNLNVEQIINGVFVSWKPTDNASGTSVTPPRKRLFSEKNYLFHDTPTMGFGYNNSNSNIEFGSSNSNSNINLGKRDVLPWQKLFPTPLINPTDPPAFLIDD